MIFEPSGTTRKYFYEIAFLIRGKSNDDTRYFMQYIKVETKKNENVETVYCVTTNGQIMHIVEYNKENTPLEDGFYYVKTNKKDIIVLEKTDETISFPSWHKIVEQMKDHVKVIEGYNLLLNKNRKDDLEYINLIFILSNLGYLIRHDYLQSLFELGVTHTQCDIYLNSYRQCDGVKFISGNCTAIIMPMNVKDLIPVIYNAFCKIDSTLKELNKNEVLFAESIVRKRKYLWEE